MCTVLQLNSSTQSQSPASTRSTQLHCTFWTVAVYVLCVLHCSCLFTVLYCTLSTLFNIQCILPFFNALLFTALFSKNIKHQHWTVLHPLNCTLCSALYCEGTQYQASVPFYHITLPHLSSSLLPSSTLKIILHFSSLYPTETSTKYNIDTQKHKSRKITDRNYWTAPLLIAKWSQRSAKLT